MKGWRKAIVLLAALCVVAGCGEATEPLAVVPDLTDAGTAAAQEILVAKGLVPVVKYEYNDAAQADTVLRTDPPAGAHVAVGSKVYLYVTAHACFTTVAPPSTTSVPPFTTPTPLSTTSTPPSATSVTQAATSTTSTQATTDATVHTHRFSDATCTAAAVCVCGAIADQAKGHHYTEGICSRCGEEDADYIATFAIGQTWTVENQWAFTIHGLTEHYLCSNANNAAAGYTDERVVIIRYSYQNDGFDSHFDQLLLDGMAFTVSDESGATFTAYACAHKQVARPCDIGETCTAEETYALPKDCRRITLLVTFLTSNGQGIVKAQFDLPIL